MHASDFMSRPPITIAENASADQAARMMIEHRIDCLPVVAPDGTLRGIITPSDYMTREVGIPFSIIRAPQLFGEWLPPGGVEQAYQVARNIRVGAIMTPPVTCRVDASLNEVVQLLVEKNVHHVIVVTDARPVGVVARHDLLCARWHS